MEYFEYFVFVSVILLGILLGMLFATFLFLNEVFGKEDKPTELPVVPLTKEQIRTKCWELFQHLDFGGFGDVAFVAGDWFKLSNPKSGIMARLPQEVIDSSDFIEISELLIEYHKSKIELGTYRT